MQTLLAVLFSVPDSIWASVSGACLALSGVLLSNKSSTARLRDQLQHDAAEKAKERTATLRREVYLDMAEQLARANSHLAKLPNLDPSNINLGEGFQGLFSAAARLQLIAEPKTAVVVSKLMSEYGEIVLDLFEHVPPVHKARTDIKIADQHYTNAQAEIGRLLGEMKRNTESGTRNPAVFQVLQSSFDFQQAQSAKFAADRDAAWSRLNVANVSFYRVLLAKVRDLAPRQVPMMLELRRDLGLTGELDELKEQLLLQAERMERRLTLLINSLTSEA
jgi:hypothetical protein